MTGEVGDDGALFEADRFRVERVGDNLRKLHRHMGTTGLVALTTA